MLDLNDPEQNKIFEEKYIDDSIGRKRVFRRGFCLIDGCHKARDTRGLCQKHYIEHRNLIKVGGKGLLNEALLNKPTDMLSTKIIEVVTLRTKEGRNGRIEVYSKRNFNLVDERETEDGYQMTFSCTRISKCNK